MGEPVKGGSTRPVAEQCGTTVRHCVIPSSESISAQRGADIRVVKDPQGGRQATRSTDRGWSLSRSAGSAGSAGSGRCLRGALGNSARALDHVATSSGMSGCGCGCGCPTSDGLRPCHAPTDGWRGHRKRDSSDGNRASRCGRWHNNRLDNLDHRVNNRVDDRVGDRVNDRVNNRVGDRVNNRVGDRVDNRVGDRVDDRVDNRVGDRVGDRIDDRVGDRIEDRVDDRIGDRVDDRIGDRRPPDRGPDRGPGRGPDQASP